MPCRLVPCDLGDPGGGDPWFPHGTLLLHSLAGMAWWSGCVVCFVALPYHTEMIQGYHLLHQLTHFTHELEPVTLLSCLCGLFFGLLGFVFLCFCVAVFCLFLVFWFCFVLCFGDDIVTVHRTTYRSFTSSLLRPLNRRRPTYAIINQLIPICNMQ